MTAEIVPVASVDASFPPLHEAFPEPAPLHVYLGSLAPGSRPAMRRALQLIVDTIQSDPRRVSLESFPWWLMKNIHMMRIRSILAETKAPATVNKSLAAARGMFKTCRRLELMSADACAAASDVPRVRGSRLPSGRALSPEEIERLLGSISQTSALGCRNRALLLLLALGGVRRAEACGLAVTDYDVSAQTLRIHGKGNKERSIPVNRTLAQALHIWMSRRGNAPGPLFCRGNRADVVFTARPFSPNGLYRMLQKLATRAEVEKISPHDFRRTFISALLDRPQNDLVTVSKLVGHANVTTTARYDRRDERSKQRAVESLDDLLGGTRNGNTPQSLRSASRK